MDDFARLTKINFANVFTQCVKSPNATSLLKDFRVELGKKYLASYHSNDSYKMTGRNKLELILSDLYELTQGLVYKAADDTMLNRVFELATGRNHPRNSTQHLIGSSQGENIFNGLKVVLLTGKYLETLLVLRTHSNIESFNATIKRGFTGKRKLKMKSALKEIN